MPSRTSYIYPMSPGAAINTLSESFFIIWTSKLAAIYQATDHDLFWMMDDEEHSLIIFLLRFGVLAVLLYAIFIILATYIYLHTSYSTFLWNLCVKVNYIVGYSFWQWSFFGAFLRRAFDKVLLVYTPEHIRFLIM